jgi:uncharacterized delta-60 repeat protein
MTKDHLGLRVKRGVLKTRPSAVKRYSVDKNFMENVSTDASGNVYAVHAQSDGRVILGGSFSQFSGQDVSGIVRINVDGSLDDSFGTVVGSFPIIRGIDQQSDGKIILVGDITQYKNQFGTSVLISEHIMRLHSNGALDTSFASSADEVDFNNERVLDVRCLPDDKILVVGEFDSVNLTPISGVARLYENGALDTSFSANVQSGKRVAAVDFQSDGRYIIGGLFRDVASNPAASYIARIYPNGALDSSFTADLAFNNDITSIEVLPDDRVLVGGDFTIVESGGTDYGRDGIVILHSNGSVDPSFNFTTNIPANQVEKVRRMPDGKIMAVFNSSTGIVSGSSIYRAVLLLHENGAIDTSFDVAPSGSVAIVLWSLDVSPDDNIYVVGGASTYNNKYQSNVLKLRG